MANILIVINFLSCIVFTDVGKPDHSIWTNELKKFVSPDGYVYYDDWTKDKSGLHTYIYELANNPVEESWTSDEKLAYWINAYNAFTIKLILDHYPVASIRELNDGKPWDEVWIRLGTQTYSLNQIENEIIRAQFKDARIHFALNCAARSCPPLLNEAYVPNSLDVQLRNQTMNFINNSRFNRISPSYLILSEIFKWYREDFGTAHTFLKTYSNVKINNNAAFGYLPYDWKLNEE